MNKFYFLFKKYYPRQSFGKREILCEKIMTHTYAHKYNLCDIISN